MTEHYIPIEDLPKEVRKKKIRGYIARAKEKYQYAKGKVQRFGSRAREEARFTQQQFRKAKEKAQKVKGFVQKYIPKQRIPSKSSQSYTHKPASKSNLGGFSSGGNIFGSSNLFDMKTSKSKSSNLLNLKPPKLSLGRGFPSRLNLGLGYIPRRRKRR